MTQYQSTFEQKLHEQFSEIEELIKDPIKVGDYTVWTQINGIECKIQLNLVEDLPELGKSIPTGRFPYTASI